MDDEVVIKRLEAGRYSAEIRQKALDVLCSAIASGRIRTPMLLRIAVILAKADSKLLSEIDQYLRECGHLVPKRPGGGGTRAACGSNN